VPLGVREPEFRVEEVERTSPPLFGAGLAVRGMAGALASGAGSFTIVALLAALKTMRDTPSVGFDFGGAAGMVAHPKSIEDWVQLVGIVVFAAIGGVFVAAALAARRGVGRR
jgi:hypothetical protein